MTKRKVFNKLSSIAPLTAVGCAIVVVVCDLIVISLNSGYNPLRQSISDLVYYPWGWLETIGISAAGLIHLLMAGIILFSPAALYNRWLRFSGYLFGLISVGVGVIALFDTDPGSTIVTLTGGIHITTVITVSILFPLNCLLLTWTLRDKSQGRVLFNYSIVLAVISLLIAWQVLPLNQNGLIGFNERLLAGIDLSWMVFASWRLPGLLNPQPEYLDANGGTNSDRFGG